MTTADKNSSAIVRNPLTVIAVFAGLAEVSATVALPQLEASIQLVFVWFVMLFPTFLVGLFFLMLWKKHHVLYAPSDFTDESNFMKHWVPASVPAQIEKDEEPSGAEPAQTPPTSQESETGNNNQFSDAKSLAKIDAARFAESRLAEDLVIRRMSRKFNLNFIRDVQLKGQSNVRYDAVADGPNGPIIIEVKVLRSIQGASTLVKRELDRLAATIFRLGNDEMRGARLLLAIVAVEELSDDDKLELNSRINQLILRSNLPVPIQTELLSLAELKSGESI